MVQVAQQMQLPMQLQSQMAAAAMYGHTGVMIQGQPGQAPYPLPGQMQFGGGHYSQ